MPPAEIETALADIGALSYENHSVMFTMLELFPPARPRVLDLFECMKARPSFEPAVNEYLPEPLTNDLRMNGTKSWQEVKKVLKSL